MDIIFGLMFTATFSVVAAQTHGMNFLVAFLKNPGLSEPKLIVTSHSSEAVHVMVSYPRNSELGFQETAIDPGQTVEISVPSDTKMRDDNANNNSAILVESTGNISLVGRNEEGTSVDEFLVFPIENLGTKYSVLTLAESDYEPEFVIVASTPNTTVMITSTNQSLYIVSLDQFEIVRFSSSHNITGTAVEANHPVAMFSGGSKMNSKTAIGHFAEQLIPVKYWGRTFICSSVSESGDILRIVGHNEAVAVRIKRNSSGEYDFYEILPLQFLQLNLDPEGSEFYLIESNDTVLVGQFPPNAAKRQARLKYSFNLVPSVEQFVSSYRLPGAMQIFVSSENVYKIASNTSIIHLFKNGREYNADLQEIFVNKSMATETIAASFTSETLTASTVFGMTLHGTHFSRLLNIALREQSQECKVTYVIDSDGFDNDCDGKVDEELRNFKDDDGDKQIDEDTMIDIVQTTSTKASFMSHSFSTTVGPNRGSSLSNSSISESDGRSHNVTMPTRDYATGKDYSLTTKAVFESRQEMEAMTTQTAVINENQGNLTNPTRTTQRLDKEVTTNNKTQLPVLTTTGRKDTHTVGGMKTDQTTTSGQGQHTSLPSTRKLDEHLLRTEETPPEVSSGAKVPSQTPRDSEQNRLTHGSSKESTQSTRLIVTERNKPTQKNDIEGFPPTTSMTNQPPSVTGTKPVPSSVKSETMPSQESNAEGATSTIAKTELVASSSENVQTSDDMSILTIVAPSFVCGVPFLVILFCCIRSMVAGFCRKKVGPKKSNMHPIQPVLKKTPNY